jgi:hypothetical protein
MQVTAELEQQRLVESGLHAEVAAREKEQARLEHELLRLQQAQIQAEAREKEQVRLEHERQARLEEQKEQARLEHELQAQIQAQMPPLVHARTQSAAADAEQAW